MGDSSANRPPAAASGTLGKTPVIHLLLYALERGLDGTIDFTAPDERTASLLFMHGEPARAQTSEPVSYLGRVLHELGFLTEAELTSSLTELARAKQNGPALHGELLLARGAIDAAKLDTALHEQLSRKVRYIAKLPPETAYSFYAGFDGLTGPRPDAAHGFDPIPMIWGALRESPPHAHIDAALQRVSASPLRIALTSSLPRLGLGDEYREAAERLRTQPVRASELGAASGLPASDARLLAYLLLVTKQVEVLRPIDSTTSNGSQPASQPRLAGWPSSPKQRSAAMPAIGARRDLPAAPEGLSPELSERWAEVCARAANIDRTDYFSMLDVPRDASPEQIQEAYFTLAKKWHPDRLPAELASIRDACSRVFARMSEAHGALSDAETRARYMGLLADGSGSPETQEAVAKVVEAATSFQKAEVCLRRSDHAQAEALCRKALEADPTQPDYVALLAWLLALKPENQTPDKTKESIQMLDRAIAMSARCEKAHFWRGMLNKRLGKAESAFRDFKHAAELNPRNIDAAREVRLHRMRRGSGRSSSSPPSAGRSVAPGPRSVPPSAPGRAGSVPPKPDEGKPTGLLGRLFKKP